MSYRYKVLTSECRGYERVFTLDDHDRLYSSPSSLFFSYHLKPH